MTRRQRLGLLLSAAVLLALVASAARADESPVEAGTVRTHSPATCRTDGGTDLRLPAGYFLPEPEFSRLDASLRTLQDDRTRLTAENASLRASASGRSLGWLYALGAGLAAGFVVGAYYF